MLPWVAESHFSVPPFYSNIYFIVLFLKYFQAFNAARPLYDDLLTKYRLDKSYCSLAVGFHSDLDDLIGTDKAYCHMDVYYVGKKDILQFFSTDEIPLHQKAVNYWHISFDKNINFKGYRVTGDGVKKIQISGSVDEKYIDRSRFYKINPYEFSFDKLEDLIKQLGGTDENPIILYCETSPDYPFDGTKQKWS